MKKLTLIVLSALALVSGAKAQNIFLNEFHYDNAGTDANEFVEVAFDSSLNISLLSVVLYNGSNGAAYTTTAGSSFTAGATSNGLTFYSFVYPADGIQNGAPDGVAIGYNGTLVTGQFLSYEGTFAGVGGIANGVTSTNIGVSETGTTETSNNSLGLIGIGRTYGNFTWSTFTNNSRGAANVGQVITPVPEPSTWVAMLGGLMALVLVQRSRKAA